jgi:hypothetical protein
MRRPGSDGTRLADTISPPATQPGELALEQPAPATVVRTRRHDRAARRGVWSPRTTLAYCWRSRTLLVLGAWLAVSPWVLGTTGDRHSTESALLTGLLLMGTAFWAMATREPVPPHACSLSLGLWLLVAPSLWYFQTPVASHNSQVAGVLVVVLSGWALWTSPRTRPPLDPGPGAGQAGAP